MLHITRYLLVAVLLLLAGCSEDIFEPAAGDGSSVAVTFRASIDTGIQSRTISDGTSADRLLVAVYEGETPVETYRKDYDLSTALTSGIELRLLSGHCYKVLFWAYDGDNTAYSVSDQGVITADYKDYLAGGFAKMEQLDAFYAVSLISVTGDKSERVTLTRPFAQLNIADNLTRPQTGTHRSEVAFESVATSFNALTGEAIWETQNLTFSFADFPEETLTSDRDTYYYIATNYLFVPASGKVTATCRLKQANDGNVITERVITDIALTANKRTNVFGSLVQQPEDIWDGTKQTEPGKDGQNRYIIDEASDLAWLVQHGSSLEQNSTFVLTKDLNMADKTLSPVVLPQGSTIEGGGHTVKNLSMNGGGLFGNATDLTVKELTVDKITVQNAATYTGALVNTLSGNGAFSSVTVKNATVATTNGAAGGMVGYVVRKSEKDRSETLALTFDGCRVESTSVSGTKSEGKFVGLLSGYDLNESVSFAADCSESDVTVADFASPYTEGNEGKWLADNDYTKYNGWLGDEFYNRGTVSYSGVRFIPRWDGVKKVTPLEKSGVKLIYSAFDLAALQGGSHTAVTFKENVDLGGDKNEKNLFTPINRLDNLDGENHYLYNLNIKCQKDWVSFVVQTANSGTTEHKNLHFVNSSVRNIVSGNETIRYASTLCSYIENAYTVSNISITDGYVFGLNKTGGLIGFVTAGTNASLNCKDVTIDGITIENTQSSGIDNFEVSISKWTVKASFNPQGEVGGLIGMLMNEAKITNCQVNNSKINCYAQNNKKPNVTGIGSGIISNAWTCPGRHVNKFIGDIRTVNGDNITITDCSATATFENRKEDEYSYSEWFQTKTIPLIGYAYALPVKDTKGNITIVTKGSSQTVDIYVLNL